MPRSPLLVASLLAALCLTSVALADHIPGHSCTGCASHKEWPTINGVIRKAKNRSRTYRGTSRNDELLGHHGSDKLYGKDGSDVLWGDWDGKGQPSTQHDYISGGNGTDFIYSSHGYNRIEAGPGNDAVSAHFGNGIVDCGPGNDIYHVPKTRKRAWKVRNCEKVDRRSERMRGGGLKPLP